MRMVSGTFLLSFTILFNLFGGLCSKALGLSLLTSFCISFLISVPASLMLLRLFPSIGGVFQRMLMQLHIPETAFICSAIGFNTLGALCMIVLSTDLVMGFTYSLVGAIIGALVGLLIKDSQSQS